MCNNIIIDTEGYCGDGIVQGDEECETGACCDLATCTYHSSIILCRLPFGYCDSADYCTGASEICFGIFNNLSFSLFFFVIYYCF